MRNVSTITRLLVILLVVLCLPALRPAAADAAATLREGARGTEVSVLQQQLKELRYDVGSVDGVFGPSTKHAVVAFQKVNGLARDGIVGARTRAALVRPVRAQVHRSRSGRYVEIDLTRQILVLAKDGKVVRIHDVSTGASATPTPRGRFTVERRIDGWRTSRLGTMWRPAYFHGGYAMHGYGSVPAYPASHGCVRLINPSMNRLWTSVTVGTPVEVHR